MIKEKHPTHRKIQDRLLALEISGFALVVFFLWMDELVDFSGVLFHQPSTPFNWTESMVETGIVLIFGVAVVVWTRWLLMRVRHLEGFYKVCAGCHRVQSGDRWIQFEMWVRDSSDAEFSHGLCPDCAERLERELSLPA